MGRPYKLSFQVLALPDLRQKRSHWRTIKKEADEWRIVVRSIVGRRKPKKPLKRCKLRLTRCSSIEPDYDNLVASFKILTDSLGVSKGKIKRADVILDDKSSVIVEREYLWEYAAPRMGCVKVEVEER